MLNITVTEHSSTAAQTCETLHRASVDTLIELDSLEETTLVRCVQAGQQDAHNVYFLEIAEHSATDLLRQLRKKAPDAHFILLLQGGINPLSFVKVDIRPSALESLPLNQNAAGEIVRELSECLTQPDEKTFLIRRGGTDKCVPLKQIFAFEARAKKIVLCTAAQEIEFYATFKEIESQLTDSFFRCHKGYIVNLEQVADVDYVQMCIIMQDKSVVPLSRNARPAFKQAMLERRCAK